MQPASWKTRIPAVAGCTDRRRFLISEGQRPTSGRGKKAIFQSDYSLIHAMVTLFSWTLESTLLYLGIRYGGWQIQAAICCIQNCSPTAAYRNVITFDSPCKVAVALSNNTIADPLRRTVYPQYMRYGQTNDRHTTYRTPETKATKKAVVVRRYLRQGKAIRQVTSPSSLCQRFFYGPFNAMVTKISKWSRIQDSWRPKLNHWYFLPFPTFPENCRKIRP